MQAKLCKWSPHPGNLVELVAGFRKGCRFLREIGHLAGI